MGMFDSVRVKKSLPLPTELLHLRSDWGEEVFQTKDLGKSLDFYEISSDGKLRHLQQPRDWEDGEKSSAAGHLDLPIEVWEEVPFHGVINFYTIISDKMENEPDLIRNPELIPWDKLVEIEGYDWWVDFEAVFDNGVVREIRLSKAEKSLIRKRLAGNKEWALRRTAEASKIFNRMIGKARKIPGYRSLTRFLSRAELKCHEKISTAIRKIS
jgi:hypothetical protein